MERSLGKQWLMVIGLVAASVVVRFAFQSIPNFAPIAAVALFAGFYFRSRWVAAAVPLSAMLITDAFIGGYQPVLMITVYGLLALPVLLSGLVRRVFALGDSPVRSLLSVGGLVGCSLLASVLFFVATNFVTWYVTPWYPRTAAGLIECYVSALPFFRYTLAGDAFFALTLFGGYALVQQISGLRSAQAARTLAVATRP